MQTGRQRRRCASHAVSLSRHGRRVMADSASDGVSSRIRRHVLASRCTERASRKRAMCTCSTRTRNTTTVRHASNYCTALLETRRRTGTSACRCSESSVAADVQLVAPPPPHTSSCSGALPFAASATGSVRFSSIDMNIRNEIESII